MQNAVNPSSASLSVRGRRGAFALVITLLILSLLIIVAVSYLSSMTAERQTADAYDSKVVAEQAAQSGVDVGTAILAQSLRDFPDSVTVWDAQQTANSGTPLNGYVINSKYNEGTSLYLRAAPTADSPATADPKFTGTSLAPNDASSNNPNNSNCQTFVLPLISGVPNGKAQLASNKLSIWSNAMKLDEPNPAKQIWADLNIRRNSADIQGVMGSPPAWTGTPTGGTGTGPKPARAYWVNQTNSTGQVIARYAYWIEDNSFRANISRIDNSTQVSQTIPARIDNTAQPQDSSTGKARSLLPSDMFLLGPLAALDSGSAAGNANSVFTVRTNYPGSYFPEARAFTHASLTTPSGMTPGGYIDQIAYLATTQSGALNLSRHGTQRVNLDAVVPAVASSADPSVPVSSSTIQTRIEQIARTIAFHLPNFGQRFYRTATDFSASTLNDATQVTPSSLTNPSLLLNAALNPATASTTNYPLIYLYKIATNIHDYIDGGTQPTFVLTGGSVAPQTLPNAPADESSPNTYWAQGKRSAPFIDEVAVRYRPIVANSTASPNFVYPRNHFDLAVDYYVEVWNMSDRDVYAAQQPSNAKLPHLNGARLAIRSQQEWSVYGGGTMVADPVYPTPSEPLMPPGQTPMSDALLVDLTSNVYGFDSSRNRIPLDGSHSITTADGRTLSPSGVVFPAGSVTVLTTDPSCFLSSGQRYPTDPNIAADNVAAYGPLSLPYPATSLHYITTPYPGATFYCGNILPDASNGNLKGQRHYSGKVQSPSGGIVSGGGLQITITNNANYKGDISLENSYGYIDFARSSIVESGTSPYTNTATQVVLNPPSYNDFSYSSSLIGNAKDISSPVPPNAPAPMLSELGDPRTNNEQLNITPYTNLSTGGNADQSRYFASNATLGYVNNSTVQPDGTNVPNTTGSSWPDYFTNGGQAVSSGAYPIPGVTNAPMVVAAAPLTSIGQLGDVFDPARLPGSGGTFASSRGGGRTLKIGQHDDRYNPTPPDYNAGAASPSVSEAPSLSNGWAAWRLTDIFSAYPLSTNHSTEPIELPGRININGVLRDNGAALRAALTGFNFQRATATSAGSDYGIHGDGHTPAANFQSLAGVALNLNGTAASSGLPEIVSAIKRRLDPAALKTNPLMPYGPFFERGELGELAGEDGQYLFGGPSGTSPNVTPAATNTSLVNNSSPASVVDMNKTFDRGREEIFRRLSELICTRGDTFTVYAVGQALIPSLVAGAAPKIAGTQHLRVTFRLTPLNSDGTDFHPATDNNGTPIDYHNLSSNDIAKRFIRPDHYGIQVLETASY